MIHWDSDFLPATVKCPDTPVALNCSGLKMLAEQATKLKKTLRVRIPMQGQVEWIGH